jgi:DNA-binding transcriptional LysR family regulator
VNGAGRDEVVAVEDVEDLWTDDRELRASLAEPVPRIPPVYGYDEHGSQLFEEITRLPTYPSSDPEFVRWALVEPRPGGQPARRGPVVRDFDEALACVAAGLGVHLVPRSVAASVNHAGVVALPVRDIAPSSYLLFLPTRVTSSVGAAFVELVLRVRADQTAGRGQVQDAHRVAETTRTS